MCRSWFTYNSIWTDNFRVNIVESRKICNIFNVYRWWYLWYIIMLMMRIISTISLYAIEGVINDHFVVYLVSTTAKRFCVVNVLDFLPSWSGDIDEVESLRLEDVRELAIGTISIIVLWLEQFIFLVFLRKLYFFRYSHTILIVWY